MARTKQPRRNMRYASGLDNKRSSASTERCSSKQNNVPRSTIDNEMAGKSTFGGDKSVEKGQYYMSYSGQKSISSFSEWTSKATLHFCGRVLLSLLEQRLTL